MIKLTAEVTFMQGTMTIQDKTFMQIAYTVFTADHGTKLVPLKIVFPQSGKVLYANEDKFHAFINGQISQENLIKETECDNLYRNKKELFCKDSGVIIEEGSLWMKKGKDCILIHEDEHLTHPYNEDIFNLI